MWFRILLIAGLLWAANVQADIKKHVYVDGKSRTAIIFSDGKGQLHIQYFTDGSMQFLGEEIFKEGQKILDTYKENDGMRD